MKGIVIRMTLAVVMAFAAGFAVHGRGAIIWPAISAVSFYIAALIKLADRDGAQ